MYGTIRLNQEQRYPDRISGTDLFNPDFAALARAFGAHGERVERTADFLPALDRAAASGKAALLATKVDRELGPTRTRLTQARATARQRQAAEERSGAGGGKRG